MALMAVTLLDNLDVKRDDYTIKVRIVKLWTQPDKYTPGETYAIEMIFQDEQGNMIEAVCSKKYLLKFQKLLEERACFLIKKPSLGHNISPYKVLDHPYKLHLHWGSTVIKCTDFNGPEYGFSFSSFQRLIENAIADNTIVDVIGYVYTYFPIQYSTNKKTGKQCRRMNVQLQDLEFVFFIYLLYEYYLFPESKVLISSGVESFLSPYGIRTLKNFRTTCQDKESDFLVVLIIQFGRFRFFEGRPYVSTTYFASNIFINSNIDDINSFKDNLLANDDHQTSSSHHVIGASVVTSLEDDFLSKTVFNSIIEVNEIAEVKKVIILGTVKCVIPDIEWYYLGCNVCTNKASRKWITSETNVKSGNVEERQIFECTNDNCTQQVIHPVPRFKIPLRVQDSTGVLSLRLFDRDAKKLLNKTAQQLLENLSEPSNSDYQCEIY